MTILARIAVSLCLLTVACASGFAQTLPVAPTLAPIPKAMPALRPQPRTVTRTVEAIVATVNAPARTVSLLLPADGVTPSQTVSAIMDAGCQPQKNNAPAPITTFAAGEKVVARLTWRLSPEPAIILRDLYDAGSYAERQKQGKEICIGVVEAFSATELTVRRTDGVSLSFRVTDKTKLVKNDAPATLAAFPVGAPVAVKPRRLPAGNLMASIVSGTTQETLWAYRDGLTTWSGTVTALQGDERNGAVVSLKRDDGAMRQFVLPADVTFTQGRTRLPWQQMIGNAVTAHFVKGAASDGMRTADGVKTASRRTRKPMEETIEEP